MSDERAPDLIDNRHTPHFPAERGKVTFLGIEVSRPGRALRHQLHLPAGTGLVVQDVITGSPAESASLQRDDVLVKLDDQLLIDEEQFSVLIRLRRPGEVVKLSIVHDGQPATLTATLAEHDEPWPDRPYPRPWSGWPDPGPVPHRVPLPDIPGYHRAPGPDAQGPTTAPAGNRGWTHDDETYTITTSKGHRYLTVERDGKSVFKGPIDTREQIEKLPTDIREEIKKHVLSADAWDQRDPASPALGEDHIRKESDPSR